MKKKRRFHNFPDTSLIRAAVEAAGLELRDCGKGHWQIRGGRFLVNFWPRTGTIHVDGTCRGIFPDRCDPVASLVAMANEPPSLKREEKSKRKAPSAMKQMRLSLWRKSSFCHWCKKDLSFRESTIDHVIPLARGGTNHPKNFVIACEACNSKRGCNMPEVTTERMEL